MNNVTEKAHEDKTVFAGFSHPQVSGVLEGKDSDSRRIEVDRQLSFRGLNRNDVVPSVLAMNRREIRRQTSDRNVSTRGMCLLERG